MISNIDHVVGERILDVITPRGKNNNNNTKSIVDEVSDEPENFFYVVLDVFCGVEVRKNRLEDWLMNFGRTL